MLDPEMIEGTTKIVNEVVKDKIQVNLIMNNRAEVPEGAFRGSPRRCGGFSIFVLCPAPYDNAESYANARQGGGDRRVQKKTHS